MRTRSGDRAEHHPIGIRPRDQVERAHDAAKSAADSESVPGFASGARDGYAWALGYEPKAPVTAMSVVAPDLGLLTAEADAALIQMENLIQPRSDIEFTTGVHRALAWVCGHTDDPA